MANEIGSLSENTRLRFGDFALVVGIADVEVRVRDHVDRPLAFRVERDVEGSAGAGLNAQAALDRARPLRDLEFGAVLAEVRRRSQIG